MSARERTTPAAPAAPNGRKFATDRLPNEVLERRVAGPGSETVANSTGSRSAGRHPRLLGLVSSELLKLTSVASARWLALAVVGAGALGALLFASDPAATAQMSVTGSATLGAIVMGILTGASIATEFSTGTIQPTVTASPRRGLVLLAKVVVAALVGVALSLLGTAAGLAVTASLHADVTSAGGTWLSADIVPTAIGAAVYVAAVGVFSLMLGVVVRSLAAVTAIVIVGLFVLPAMIGSLRVGGHYVSDYLLSEAGPSLVGASSNGFGTGSAMSIAVVSAWMLVAALVAGPRLLRRDV